MKQRKISLVFCAVLYSYLTVASAQAETSKGLYRNFDEFVGLENTVAYQGQEYRDPYRTVNEFHRYYKTDEFSTGKIIYQDQPFFDLPLRYDIFEDELFLKLQDNYGSNPIRLYKNYIKEFSIYGKRFVSIESNTTSNDVASGFFEVVQESERFTFYLKPKKQIYKRTNKENLYYEFFQTGSSYLLLYDNKHYWLKNHHSLKKIFPEFRAQIQDFARASKRLRRSKPDEFISLLLKKISAWSAY